MTVFRLVGLAVLMTVSTLSCFAEIPKVSEARLTEICSHALDGKVVQIYHSAKKTTSNSEITYGVAEIDIRSVKKGDEMESGDRVYVRYWRKRWIGTGRSEPGHYGHWDIPSQGDHVTVYVKGDRKTGYDVMSPNGFFAVVSPEDRSK